MTQLKVIKPQYFDRVENMAFEDNERLIIGACLIDQTNYDMIRAILSAKDFFFIRYQTIMETMEALEQDGKPITPLAVAGRLKDNDKLTELGGVTTLLGYKSHAKEHPEIDYIPAAVAIKEAAVRINLLETTDNIRKLAMRRDLNINVIEVNTRNYIDQTFKTLTTRTTPTLAEGMSQYFDLKDHADKDTTPGRLYTGLHELDNPSLLGGFKRKDLVLIGGESSMGKTALAVTLSTNMMQAGRKGIFISMEMDVSEMVQRFIATGTGIGLQKLIPHTKYDMERMTADWQHEIMMTAKERSDMVNYMGNPFMDNIGLIHRPSLTALEVWSEVRRFKIIHGNIDFCVVDLITNMTADERDKSSGRHEELTKIAGTLKQIAQEENLTMFALSQASGAVASRSDRRPLEGDFRDSKGIGFQADVQIFVYRHYRINPMDPTTQKDEAEILIRKHRGGAIGARKVRFEEKPARFMNWSK